MEANDPNFLKAKAAVGMVIVEAEEKAYDRVGIYISRFKSLFRVGCETIQPTRVLINKEDLINYLNTIQGLISPHIVAHADHIRVYLTLQHTLRRNRIFKDEILFEIKKTLQEWKPMGLKFRIFIK